MSEPNKNNNTDDSLRLLSAVGGVGDDLLQEAQSFAESSSSEDRAVRSAAGSGNGKKPSRFGSFLRSRKAGLIAAALAVALTAGILIPVFVLTRPENPSEESDPKRGISEDPIISDNLPVYASDAFTDVPDALRTLTVTSDGSAVSGRILPTKAVLRVQTASSCDTETFARYVKLSPAVPLSVTKESDDTFVLEPAGTGFATDTVYRLTVGDPENPNSSFAFQTASEPRIRSVFPADLNVGVPVSTGIEIAFTESVRQTDFSSFFSISPDTDGSFRLSADGKTVAFVPEKDLEFDTVYTVTVSGGLTGVSGKTIADGRSFSFRTESEIPEEGRLTVYPSLSTAFSTNGYEPWTVFGPNDAVIITAWFHAVGPGGKYVSGADLMSAFEKGQLKLKATFYRAKDLSRLVDAVAESEARLASLDAMEPELDRSLFEKVSECSFARDGDTHLLRARASLEQEGSYLVTVEATYGSLTATSNLAASVSKLRYGGLTSDGKTLLFVTDDEGRPASGASVTGYAFGTVTDPNGTRLLTETLSARTDSDGALLVDNGSAEYLLFRVSHGGSELLLFGSSAQTEKNPYYMRTMYTDRSVYFPTDTIHVWGTVRRQYEDDPFPDGDLYLATSLDSRKIPVALDENGSYRAEISFENVSQYWGSTVTLLDGEGRAIQSRTVRITQEEKPVVQGSILFDKACYAAGETVTGVFRLSFFDGTAASGYQTTLFSSEFELEQSGVLTDENGEIRFSVPTGSLPSCETTAPVSVSVRAILTGEGTDRVDVRNSVTYFHSDYSLRTGTDSENVLVRLNKWDLSRYPDDPTGEPAEGKAVVTLVRYRMNLKERTEYDPYSKRRYTVYSTDISESVEETGERNFRDGVIRLAFRDSDDPAVWYAYRVSFNDGRRNFRTEIGAASRKRASASLQKYNLTLDSRTYLVGDTIRASLTEAGGSRANALFAFFSNGYLSRAYGKEASVECTDGMIPSVLCYVLFFNPDTGAIAVNAVAAEYDVESSVKEMEVRTDKESYGPGEQAVITVRAPGLAGGKALISITDEACFALGENNYDIRSFFRAAAAGDSYARNGYGLVAANAKIVRQFTPRDVFAGGRYRTGDPYAEDLADDAPAEGEEPGANNPASGSVYVRERFENTAVFATVSIGQDGTGALSIELPDNLTSWRVTAIGVRMAEKTSECAFGTAVSGAVVTLPMQVKADLNSRYVEGDAVVAGFRCFGASTGGSASYAVSLADADGNEIRKGSLSGDAGTLTYASFGKLESGDYTLTVTASCGGYSDGLRLPVRVIPSAMTVSRTADLTNEDRVSGVVSPASYPVRIEFRNTTESERFLRRIADALRYADASAQRADAAAAAYAAQAWMNARYGLDETQTVDPERFGNYLDTTGGSGFCGLFPYAEGDLMLTAQILDAAPDLLASSRSRLTSAFYKVLKSARDLPTDAELCAALYGLAVLDEPVLDYLTLVSARAGSYSPEAKLYLANAFAAIGDYASSAAILDALVSEYAKEAGNGTALYFDMGDTESEIRCSSLALLAASRVSRASAEKLANYLIAAPHRSGESPDLALAVFLTRYLPTERGESKTVRYTLADGEERTIDLPFGKCSTVLLYKADFEAFRMSNPDGALATAVYSGSPDPETDASADNRLTVDKTIDGTNVYIKIIGTSDKRYEYFAIDEVIPSGARYQVNPSVRSSYVIAGESYHADAYVYNTEGQQMKGTLVAHSPNVGPADGNLLYCDPYEFSITLTYSLREAIAGEFAVEPAILTDSSGRRFYSEGDKTVTFVNGATVTEIGNG